MKNQNKKINLLYLINSFDIGGAEKAMSKIVSGLDKEKYNITVVALKMGSGQIVPEIEKSGIETVNLEAKNKFDFRIIFKLYKLLKDKKVDILWCSLFHATFLGRITGRLLKIPIIINWEHNERFYGFFRVFLNKITSLFSDIIVADSEKVALQVKNQLKIPFQKIKVIPICGLDINNYFKIINKRNKSKCIVGSVGMLNEQKGYSYLIKSAKIVIQKYSKTEFIIAGEGSSRSKLEQLISESNLTNSLKLLGYQSDIPKILSKVDIYVQPSLWEGLCITVIEAMASGLPVIASDVGGVSESVVNGRTGFLVPPKDPEILAKKIIHLIKNPNLRKEMGENGRKIAEKKYSTDKMMAKIENLLNEIIKNKLL